MIFLTKADLFTKITLSDLDTVTGGDDSILDHAELNAMAEIATYLRPTYDMPLAWSRLGFDRYALLVQHCVIVLLYHVHTRMAPNNVPQSRIYDYDNTLKFLKAVASGDYRLDLPLYDATPEDGCAPLPPSRVRFVSYPNQDFSY